LALKKGEINALVIQPVNSTEYGAGTGVTIYSYPEDRVGYLSFNLGSPRVQDINYRKAVFFALNRTEQNTGVYLSPDYYVDAVSFLPYSSSFFTYDLEKYEFSLSKSNEFLNNVSSPQPIRIAHSAGNAATETQAIIIQQELKAAGITAEVVAIESNSLFDKLEDGTDEFEMFLNGYIMGIDPSNYASLFVSDAAYNYARVADEELDGYFAAGSVETDSAKRVAIYQNAQRRLAELAVQYPIVTNLRLLAMTDDVAGVEAARLIPIYTFENFGSLYFK
jgi:peptide/nickel transport system substrate-binding protein